ncbi:MAG TPA: sigma factor, partial [Anaerolineales bacterium]|nr:sigma factor [Anaerolineales bacterium]
MKSSDTVPSMEAIREEGVLVRRAKAGDADAFLELYDAYGDDLYRYVYFRVMNDVAAEAITAHVFGHAWDRLDDHRKRASSFVRWLYSIARNQLVLYYRLNVDAKALGIGCLPAAVDYSLSTDGNDWTNREAWSGHLRLLAAEKQYGLQQTATLLIMRRSLDHLSPGRKAKPSPTFNAYSRSWLTRYLQYHARVPSRAPIVERLVSTYKLFERSVQPRWGQLKQNVSQLGLSLPRLQPAPMRMSVVYAALMFALLFTGTAEAQSALPGDPLYGWKRTSEQAWLSLSPDPVGTGIILANRRLNEWLAVENDPARRSGALSNYIQALTDLSSVGGSQAVSRVVPVLEGHRRRLQNSGLA